MVAACIDLSSSERKAVLTLSSHFSGFGGDSSSGITHTLPCLCIAMLSPVAVVAVPWE